MGKERVEGEGIKSFTMMLKRPPSRTSRWSAKTRDPLAIDFTLKIRYCDHCYNNKFAHTFTLGFFFFLKEGVGVTERKNRKMPEMIGVLAPETQDAGTAF